MTDSSTKFMPMLEINFSSAPEASKLAHQKQLKICIIIHDLPPLMKNDTLSFSPLRAAECLAKAGHAVSLLSVFSHDLDDRMLKKYQSYYSKKSICLIPFSYQGPQISSLLPAVQSYQVLYWMLENASAFDIVHFLDIPGWAYYTLLAKHQGWAFQHLEICVSVHSLTLWNKHVHKQAFEHVNDLATDYLAKESIRLADCVINLDDSGCDWVKLHADLKIPRSHLKASEELPLVSVCLTHFNRPHYLAQALESIRNQDYPNFEVILVDDASTLPEVNVYLDSLEEEFVSKGWQIICNQHNLFPGAARNLAARQSRGEYLLFMDDDNYAKPHEIRIFVEVVKRVGADILTCAMDVFHGSSAPLQKTPFMHRFLPLGAAVAVGLYLNIFGDINALIKKQVYEELNGLTEDHGIGGEDWELFARAVLKGYHLETIPLALFWYRDTPQSITKSTSIYANYLRGIRAYLAAVPDALHANLILSQMQQEKMHQLLIDYNSLRKLLRRCCQLFFNRARRVLCHPRRSIKKIANYF